MRSQAPRTCRSHNWVGIPWHGYDWTAGCCHKSSHIAPLFISFADRGFANSPPLPLHFASHAYSYTKPTFWTGHRGSDCVYTINQIRRQQFQLREHNRELQQNRSWIRRGCADYALGHSSPDDRHHAHQPS